MAPSDLILAIDQGTSATKTLLVDSSGVVVASGTDPLEQTHPRPGWVEQSPLQIIAGVRSAVHQCFSMTDDPRTAERVVAVGLSTQRESVVLWDRATGAPLAPLLSWQDQRTAGAAERLGAGGTADLVRELTGLPLDPMFSALKAQWLLDTHDPDRTRSRAGQLCLGTVDSWLIAQLCGEHRIEVGNAARTQLLNLGTRQWDDRLLEIFNIPPETLPVVLPSAGLFGRLRERLGPLSAGVPITGVLGDSHAALYAHGGWHPGLVKATYGTGSSVMAVTGTQLPDRSGNALTRTIGWDDGTPAYAVEGNIRSSGATVNWLAELVGRSPAELAELARGADSDGVVIVPAFSGLGAPHWDSAAVGLISNLNLGTRLPALAKAALESVVFQIDDVVRAVAAVVGPVQALLVDGGPTRNSMLMQLQADTSGCLIRQPSEGSLSAVGAAHIAGLGAGRWSRTDLQSLARPSTDYRPVDLGPAGSRRREAWVQAVARSRYQAARSRSR